MVHFEHFIRTRIAAARAAIKAAAAAVIMHFFLWLVLVGIAYAAVEPPVVKESSEKLKLKDRLYEIEALINKKHSEIERIKERLESVKGARRIKDDEYQSTRMRLDESEKKARALYDEKVRLAKTLKLNTDNLLRKKSLLNDRIRAAYKNSFRKKMGYVIKSESFVDFYVNLGYLTRIIKFDAEFISEVLKKVALIKRQRAELEVKIKELELVKNNARECEASLKKASERLGGEINELYESEMTLKQELSVLYLEKERIEKQIVEEEPLPVPKPPTPDLAGARQNSAAREGDGGSTTDGSSAAAPLVDKSSSSAETKADSFVDISSLVFSWPMKYSKNVLSFYGAQKDPKYNVSYFNSGIDITGSYGEEIVAAADGRVKYKGEMKSVGKLLIIDHGGNITTLYSHLGMIEVGMGQKVKRGETIGRLREKGAVENTAEKPLLHFEIRINGNAKDPMDYL